MLIAVRDDRGFRPLCYGLTEDGRYVVASESCALDAVGAKFVRDIEPGEIVISTMMAFVVSRITAIRILSLYASLNTSTSQDLTPRSTASAFTALELKLAGHWRLTIQSMRTS